MPELQTRVQIPDYPFEIDYKTPILLLGSCFADNIGVKLNHFRFNSFTNPFGVLYNPASVSQAIIQLLHKPNFTTQDLKQRNELWYSFSHHTLLSSVNIDDCLNNINTAFKQGKEQLKNARVIFLTLGTSWIFKLKHTNEVVANCHKLPASEFHRQFLSSTESASLLQNAISEIKNVNPNINIVLTLSPIRHWKDGAIENMRSKASLILAIQELCNKLDNTFYFPVYEIFMDELRDYRFYSSDMIHPSEFAIDYIWELFQQTFFSKETLSISKKVDKIVKATMHKPTFAETTEYKNFTLKLSQRIEQFQIEYPHINI